MVDLEFSEEQIERYSRHILLQEVGVEGQKKLLESRVLMVGAGGLGSPALLYLAAAGVGKIGIVDDDVVDMSNLQRQIIHFTTDVGKDKVLSAQEAIGALNPDCEVTTYRDRLGADNIREVVRDYDIVLDGSDNFPTRFLIADCCWLENIPLVSAAAVRFQGQLMTVLPGEGNPCYRCVFPEPPPAGMSPSCREAGILGAVVGVMGSLQALEAIKILAGIGEVFSHKMLIYDALDAGFFTVKRAPDPDCKLSGKNQTITDLDEYDYSCEMEPEAAGDTT